MLIPIYFRRFSTKVNAGMNICTNCLMVASFFVGRGPGGLKHITEIHPQDFLKQVCLPGSSHGGNVPSTKYFQVGDSYDKENLVTFLGGSGGDAIHSISVFLFL